MDHAFDTIWERIIKPLEGKTVLLLEDQQPNAIREVTNDFLERDGGNDVATKKIQKTMIKAVYDYIMVYGEINGAEIDGTFPGRHASMIGSILTRLPNIRCELNPMRLYRVQDAIDHIIKS